jgi:RNA polymerase sigma-70 factor, ECF subfamily
MVVDEAREAAQREVEQAVRAACEAGDFQAAATMLLESIGPKVFAFVLQRLRDPVEASEAFSMFSEDLWRGLPGFGWRCTVRGWSFAVARHAADRRGKQLAQRRKNLPISQSPLAEMVAEVRERTLLHLRTEVKSQVKALFEELPADDRALLELRLDQRLSFREVALALEYEGELPSDADLTRAAAKFRKRYQMLKQQLRERLARAEVRREEA